jgi:hypothetical protein
MTRRERPPSRPALATACFACVISTATLSGVFSPLARTAEPDEESRLVRERVDETLRLATAEAKTYDIVVGAKSKTTLQLEQKSILRWSNPLTGAYGEAFLWTNRTRPRVIASVYQYYSPARYLAVEFQSLAPDGLIAKRGAQEVWKTPTPGVEFKALSTAPRPADTQAKRLAQMRTLAREFEIRFTTPDGEKEWLRLMTQPNYRYECAEEKILDGAVFIFAQGTNPEAVLLIEARQMDEGDQWHFALARQTGYQLDALRDEKVVWSVPAALGDQRVARTEPYTTFFRSHNDGAPEK